MNPPHATEERAVFAQLKPVRMSGADGPEDASVFEDVKPAVRVAAETGGPGGPEVRPPRAPLEPFTPTSMILFLLMLFCLFK